YKAHAFLSAGNEVQRWKAFDLVRPRDEEPPPSPWLLGIQHASSVVFVAALVYAVSSHEPGGVRGAFALVVPVGLALSVAAGSVAAAPFARAGRLALRAAIFAMAVLATHFFATKVPGVATTATPSALELAVVGIGFTSLAIVDVLLRCLPRPPFVATLRVQLFGGFYLDEIFTRLTFELWPPKRLPPKPDHESAVASGLTRPAFGGSACPTPSSAKVAS
ncbi:MAG: hypothetical protein JST00_40445, partial [Deltaproteobacteria bacterium]|nr:hypothetical protein [Deltaproteobacteria bacterium]